jgi:hypothetical protein
MQLPQKLHGCGLRSHVESIPAAFIGALESAVPFFIQKDDGARAGLMPPLEAVLGEGAFDKGNEHRRWAQLLESKTPTGESLKDAMDTHWLTMQNLERGGKVMPPEASVYKQPQESWGNGGETGATRAHMTSELERMKMENLVLQLKEETPSARNGALPRAEHLVGDLRVEQRRALDAIKECKIAMQLTATVPTTGSLTMDNLQFTHGFARVMGLPPPMYAPYIGTELPNSRAKLDAYGWKLEAETGMSGGDWDACHDSTLHLLWEQGRKAGLRIKTEIYNLFAASCPQMAKPDKRGLYDTDRKRQGLVPDAHILQGQENIKSTGLAELKFIRCCPSRYPGTNGRTAVATRASKIQSE